MRNLLRQALSCGKLALPLSIVLIGSSLAVAQTLPPGQMPAGPPAQPGQVAPNTGSSPAPQANSPTPEAAPSPGSATDDTVFRGGARYLLVPTTVLDPDGHGYVNGLGVKDFQVLDNGKSQRITSEAVQQPVSVVLAVQANSEVEGLLPAMRKSGLLLQGLVTGQDGDAAILAFDHRMQVVQDFTNDVNKLDDAMQKVTAGSSTAALIDAVMKSDQMLRDHDRQGTRRRVIILMSRNVDKGSQVKLEEAVHRMQFDNVLVYCIDISRWRTALMKKADYPRPFNGGIPPEAQGSITGQTQTQTTAIQQADGNWLNTLPPLKNGIQDLFKRSPAEAFSYFTGGNIYTFAKERTLERAITDIGENLNSQYLITYAIGDKQDPGFHTIRVIVDRPGMVVRTRPGYWWGGGIQ